MGAEVAGEVGRAREDLAAELAAVPVLGLGVARQHVRVAAQPAQQRQRGGQERRRRKRIHEGGRKRQGSRRNGGKGGG